MLLPTVDLGARGLAIWKKKIDTATCSVVLQFEDVIAVAGLFLAHFPSNRSKCELREPFPSVPGLDASYYQALTKENVGTEKTGIPIFTAQGHRRIHQRTSGAHQ